MSAYLIFTREETLDEAELKIYWEKIKGTFAGHQVKVLVAYGRHEVLEGDSVEGVVIAEFPTFEAAKAWYDSPAYQAKPPHQPWNGPKPFRAKQKSPERAAILAFARGW